MIFSPKKDTKKLNQSYFVIRWLIELQNNSENLDPSYKKDLNFRNSFGRETPLFVRKKNIIHVYEISYKPRHAKRSVDAFAHSELR